MENRKLDEVRKELDVNWENISFEASNEYQKKALEYILENPYKYAYTHFWGIKAMFFGGSSLESKMVESGLVTWGEKPSTSSIESIDGKLEKALRNYFSEIKNGIISVKFWLENLFFILGLIVMWRKKDYFYVIFMSLIILYFANIVGVYYQYRFKIVFYPLYLVITAKGIFEVLNLFKNWRGAKAS
jgi:hypothetical protein